MRGKRLETNLAEKETPEGKEREQKKDESNNQEVVFSFDHEETVIGQNLILGAFSRYLGSFMF